MEPLAFDDLPEQALLLVDSAPIIHFLENHPKFAPHFEPLFAAHGTGRLRFAVTTITIAEVLTGPLRAGDEVVARRYRATLEGWQVVELNMDVAESAARGCVARSGSSYPMRFKRPARWQSTPQPSSRTIAISRASIPCGSFLHPHSKWHRPVCQSTGKPLMYCNYAVCSVLSAGTSIPKRSPRMSIAE